MKPKIPKILPGSFHRGSGWRTQYERLERWFERIKSAQSKEDCADFIFAFFQNCYHLKDYLLETAEIKKSEIEDLFSQKTEMGICRDICNVTKHCHLNFPPSQKYEISFIQTYAPQNHPYFSPGWFGDDAKLLVVADDKNYDARELAFTCLNIWKEFLRGKNLLD